jgi:hypothetical protein
MEGGFNTNSKQEWEETSRIVIWPSMDAVELKDPDLPLQVRLQIAADGIGKYLLLSKSPKMDYLKNFSLFKRELNIIFPC